MRTSRRYRPVFDGLQDRIVPSTITVAPVAGGLASSAVVTAMDETGGPGLDPSGDGSDQIIMTPPGGAPPSTSTVC